LILAPWRAGEGDGRRNADRWQRRLGLEEEEKGEGHGWAGLGQKAERSGPKEKEHGPQGVCGPKCKRAVETIFDFRD
jgi:hypothetical protein